MVTRFNDKQRRGEKMKKAVLVVIAIVSILLVTYTQSHDYQYMKDLRDSTYIEYKPNDTMRNPMTGELVTTIEER